MTIRPVEPAQQTAARIAGALYLVILVIPRGGHFAPIEELLARDISAFFAGRS